MSEKDKYKDVNKEKVNVEKMRKALKKKTKNQIVIK